MGYLPYVRAAVEKVLFKNVTSRYKMLGSWSNLRWGLTSSYSVGVKQDRGLEGL